VTIKTERGGSTNFMASQFEEADNRAGASQATGAGSITTSTEDMRSGSDQRGRYNGNRPFGQQPRTPQRSHSFDSNGPGVKIRGSAHQIFERYVALAREMAISGDPIAAENLYQHAEHYFRLANANRDGDQQGTTQRTAPAGAVTTEQRLGDDNSERSEPGWGDDRPGLL
jgi:hypothetical protein